MTYSCPCCGQPVTGSAPPSDNLSPQQRDILDIVMRRPGQTVTVDEILRSLYMHEQDEPKHARAGLYAQIHRINRALGNVIENTYGGYRMRSNDMA